ncbi:winged helix DNA-binding domain-containing protein [Aquihabitans daechungensis]|uniref:winged helix DNA-binding domain-containing protein n=1 Tax=Aquihabitans daechungensis TaxID=1052257 RepID=UPI003BA25427
MAEVVSQRQLNRTTLQRQFLLERTDRPALEVVAHLVGLQAQEPIDPYLAMWSRLADFDPDAFGARLTDRSVVRIVVMRGTIHLVTADDCLFLRPLIQPVLDRELRSHQQFKAALATMDLAPVLAFARPLLSETPLPGTKLRAAIAERFPDLDAGAAAYACRNHLALVQVPPRGVWGQTLQVTNTPAEAWLGRPLRSDATVDEMVVRYLAAFGPSSPADASAWSGLTGMREVFDRLAPLLRTYRNEAGRELFDLAEAELADPDLPAPCRFLPEYDNVLLSHRDRTRFFPTSSSTQFDDARFFKGTATHDGLVVATWWIERDKEHRSSTLHVSPTVRLTRPARHGLEEEAQRMVAFREPGAEHRSVDVGRDPV